MKICNANVANFLGVIEFKELNHMLIYDAPICFVTNIDEHWVSFWISKSHIEIYDGLGESSGLKDNAYFVNFLCNNLINRNLNITRQIQNDESVLCGQFSVICLQLRSCNVLFDAINTHFSENLEKNDDLIIYLFKDLTKII